MEYFRKDPGDTLDYTRRASRFLDGDTIFTSTWTVEPGITVESSTNDTTSATIWLSGGISGNEYTVTNTIVTAGGRTKDLSFILVVEDQ